MIFEIVLFIAWLCVSTLVIIAAFYVGRFICKKIEEFFDGLCH